MGNIWYSKPIKKKKRNSQMLTNNYLRTVQWLMAKFKNAFF